MASMDVCLNVGPVCLALEHWKAGRDVTIFCDLDLVEE